MSDRRKEKRTNKKNQKSKAEGGGKKGREGEKCHLADLNSLGQNPYITW
jgi:hypothetical protein